MIKTFNKLLRIFCIPTAKMRVFLKKEMKKYPEMKKESFGKEYLFYRGTLPVLLVAHMDTVHREIATVDSIAVYKGRVTAPFTGLGADDRLGIFGILEMMERGHRPHVLFTDKEEVGGKGAKEFAKYCKANKESLPQINFMVELDRMNKNDAAMYSCTNQKFIKHLSNYGYQRAHGTYTDICDIMPVLDRAGTNISVGYYRQHTKDEYFVISEYYTNMDRLERILLDVLPDQVFTHRPASKNTNSSSTIRGFINRDYDTALTLFDKRFQQTQESYESPLLIGGQEIDEEYGECDYCLGIFPKDKLQKIDGEEFCSDCINYSLPYYKTRGF